MKKSYILLFLCTIIFFTSCLEHRVYDHYEHTPLSGWEKNDSLFFNIPSLAETDNYNINLGLRINSTYPFQAITLIIKQTVYPGGNRNKKTGFSAGRLEKTYIDTLNCRLTNKNGRIEGRGIGSFQYHFPVTRIQLNKGDSIHICISHNMKQEILPGISDIGIEYVKE
ncbi:MAG: gliding motility lipoprotein GldH [Prevotella sp.]|mgnify:CR=1 FL=1|nr:gliding motility lipoprotein GldH [Prevotella sp.]